VLARRGGGTSHPSHSNIAVSVNMCFFAMAGVPHFGIARRSLRRSVNSDQLDLSHRQPEPPYIHLLGNVMRNRTPFHLGRSGKCEHVHASLDVGGPRLSDCLRIRAALSAACCVLCILTERVQAAPGNNHTWTRTTSHTQAQRGDFGHIDLFAMSSVCCRGVLFRPVAGSLSVFMCFS